MVRISETEIQRDFNGWLSRVQAGETVVILRNNEAVAELIPVPPTKLGRRPIGLSEGKFVVPDDFDAPLPEDVLRDFEGG